MIVEDFPDGVRTFGIEKAGKRPGLYLNRFDQHSIKVKCNGSNHECAAMPLRTKIVFFGKHESGVICIMMMTLIDLAKECQKPLT